MPRKTKTMRLIGGERNGETISVIVGLPFARMARRLPLPKSPVIDIAQTSKDDSELYVRRLW